MKKEVQTKFESYPENIQKVMHRLRSLIYEVAHEDGVDDLEECLKWGEPSYTSKKGSTLRIDWKEKDPNHYAMYFHCKTSLVETFRELYPQEFRYSKNRAIVFPVESDIPEKELKHCVSLALRYHMVKNKVLLGA